MPIEYLLTGLLFLGAYGLLQVLGTQRYKELLEPLDNKEFSVKPFLPGGLLVVDWLRLDRPGRYQVWIRQKIVMLHGSRYASYYIHIHWACKILYLVLGVGIASIMGFLGEAGSDWIPFIPGFGVLLFFMADKNLEDQYRKKRLSIERDFPDFISKLVLLVNAGLPVRLAIERIVGDGGKDTVLYREFATALNDIKAGIAEQEAYSDFAERCKVKEITNFVSILLQNMKLGGGQMLFELKRMGTECWDMRKNTARQLGETASSKLMFPLAIMFIAIVMICTVPAVMIFRGLV